MNDAPGRVADLTASLAAMRARLPRAPDAAGRRVEEIGLPPGAQVGAIVRGLPRADGSEAGNEAQPQVLMAHPDTVIQTHDHVIFFVPNKRTVRQVEKLFQVSATFF